MKVKFIKCGRRFLFFLPSLLALALKGKCVSGFGPNKSIPPLLAEQARSPRGYPRGHVFFHLNIFSHFRTVYSSLSENFGEKNNEGRTLIVSLIMCLIPEQTEIVSL